MSIYLNTSRKHSRACWNSNFSTKRVFRRLHSKPNASLWWGNWSSRVDEPRPMELRPFWRWQRAVWFLWDEFPSPVTVPALSFAFVPSSFSLVVEIANLRVQRDRHACVRAYVRTCVRACARKCTGSYTNVVLNAVPKLRRWYHSAWRMISFAPAFSVGRAGATFPLAFVEENRDRKPGLATNPERIGSVFDRMSSAKGQLQPERWLWNRERGREAKARWNGERFVLHLYMATTIASKYSAKIL